MGRVAASRSFVSIIFISMVTATSSLPMCPMSAPTGAWLPGVVYKAVSAGKPNVSLPLKADGFNRTLSINGFCTPSGLMDLVSSAFSGSLMGGEFQAGYKANVTTTTMSFAGVTCSLKSIAIYKTPQASFEAEMRFQFEDCQATGALPSPVSMALVSGLRRDAMAFESNVLKWTKEVLEVAGTPPPPAPAKIGVMSNTVLQMVGNGTCKAVARHELKGVPTKDACKMRCLGEITTALATNAVEGGCSGFAFSAAAAAKTDEKSCILYDGNSSVTESNYKDLNAKGFFCFNMSMGPAEVEKSTALVTTTQAPQRSTLDFTQREIFAAHPLAYASQISAPADQPGCFNPVWWFRLTDQNGNPMSAPMSDADLNELLEILPKARELNGTLSAPTVLDRVVVDACNFDNHWGRPTCFVPPPKTSPTCHSDAIGNAVVTGVVTALGTWLLVGTAFFLIHGSNRRTKDKYEQLVEDRTPKSPCPPITMFITSVVAVGAACGCSFGAFQLVNEILRSQSCYDSDEAFVVFLPACLSAAIAVVLVLQYTARIHPMHSHPMLTQPQKPVDKPQTSLVLVEVPDGAKAGTPVNMQPGNTMSGSPMSTLQFGGSGR